MNSTDPSLQNNTQVTENSQNDPESTNFQPKDPIILNPGYNQSKTEVNSKRGFLSTFGLLFAGWLVGNLLIVSLVSLFAVVLVGSTGLVKVPVLSAYFFGKETPLYRAADQYFLESAEEKLAKVAELKKGQAVKQIELTENEINALLNKEITETTDFPIANQSLKILENEFIFSGRLVSTNAPVEIRGQVLADNLTAKVDILSAKFGKIELPSFISTNIINENLSRIGLSLSGSQLPAQSIQLRDGQLVLEEVVNPAN